MIIFLFSSSCPEKATEAVYIARNQNRLGAAFDSEFSGCVLLLTSLNICLLHYTKQEQFLGGILSKNTTTRLNGWELGHQSGHHGRCKNDAQNHYATLLSICHSYRCSSLHAIKTT